MVTITSEKLLDILVMICDPGMSIATKVNLVFGVTDDIQQLKELVVLTVQIINNTASEDLMSWLSKYDHRVYDTPVLTDGHLLRAYNTQCDIIKNIPGTQWSLIWYENSFFIYVPHPADRTEPKYVEVQSGIYLAQLLMNRSI